MLAQCISFTGTDSVAIATTEMAGPGPEDIVVETRYSCISPGTELRCLAGQQEGLGIFSFPFIPGYSLVGNVIRADAAGRHKEGSLVFCSGARNTAQRSAWGGHISHAVVPASAAFVVPPEIEPVEASLLKLAAIAYRGFRLSRFVQGERVLVLGLGPIGQLSARIFQAAGADVIAADLAASRVAIAAKAGLRAVCIAERDTRAVTGLWPQGAHIVVDATGFAPALMQAVSLVSDKPWDESEPAPGRLIVQGSYAGDVLFPQGAAFAKELMVLWPRDNQMIDMREAAGLLSRKVVSGHDLVSGIFPFEAAPRVYPEMRSASRPIMTAVFKW